MRSGLGIFVTSMVLCGLGIKECAMHNTTIQKTTFFELGVFTYLLLLNRRYRQIAMYFSWTLRAFFECIYIQINLQKYQEHRYGSPETFL